MRILITGSNGLLGQKLVRLLQSRPELVFLATSSGQNRMEDLEEEHYQSMDITDAAQVNEVLSGFRPDAVINTAAMTLVDLCETEQERCESVNVTAVQYLLDACRVYDAHLVQVSTDFVFDGEDGPYRETDEPNPLSEYSRSKYRAEQLLIDSDYGNWSIARTIILYGYEEGLSRSNVVIWARQALHDGGPMRIVHDQFRAPTLAEDLAIGCLAIAERKALGIYHLSGPETMSVLEMVKRIARYYDISVEHIEAIDTASLGQPAARPPRTGFILDKARKDLDYRPRSIEEGLALLDKQLPIRKG